MNGIPHDFDPAVFVGHKLISVTFAENLINLTFDQAVMVTVLSSISYRDAKTGEQGTDQPPVSRTSLVSLLGQDVAASRVESKQQLVIELDDGELVLRDDSQRYESFIIRVHDREIVV
jgi:hypothetical protein